MGVFGAGIFSDDDALDVRGGYKAFLADSQADALATDARARQYGATFEDPAATTSFWLALAWTQWAMGRLDPRVKSCALRSEGTAAYVGLTRDERLHDLLTDVLEPYWENPALPPHHPGFDKPEAQFFKRRS